MASVAAADAMATALVISIVVSGGCPRPVPAVVGGAPPPLSPSSVEVRLAEESLGDADWCHARGVPEPRPGLGPLSEQLEESQDPPAELSEVGAVEGLPCEEEGCGPCERGPPQEPPSAQLPGFVPFRPPGIGRSVEKRETRISRRKHVQYLFRLQQAESRSGALLRQAVAFRRWSPPCPSLPAAAATTTTTGCPGCCSPRAWLGVGIGRRAPSS